MGNQAAPVEAAVAKSQARELSARELSATDGSFGSFGGFEDRSDVHGFTLPPLINLSGYAAITDDRTTMTKRRK